MSFHHNPDLNVLFRSALAETYELEAAKRIASTSYSLSELVRTKPHPQDVVVPRYYMLPFYKDTQSDIEKLTGCKIINSFSEHRYVADLKNWYSDLKDLTPKTYFDISQIPEGSYVLKGETNSKKQQWKKQMFASSKTEAFEVCSRLMNDGYVGTQNIYAREYVPLSSFGEAVNGMPISEEYRFFYYRDKQLTGGFYWSEHVEYVFENQHRPNPKLVPEAFLEKIANIVSPNIPFWVVDVAKTQTGDWIVIELNDGCMSGLSCCPPYFLYKNLKHCIQNK